LTCADLSYACEKESHRMLGLGRDLCGSSSPTPQGRETVLMNVSLSRVTLMLLLGKYQ